MENICERCEYGNRFVDLGICPDCKEGRIIGDFHTKDIICSKSHPVSSFAVDFCGKQNCFDLCLLNAYEVIITARADNKLLSYLQRFTSKTTVEIYKAVKQQVSFCGSVSFYQLLKIGRYLYEKEIPFRISPEIPMLYKFTSCFPDYADDYGWVLKYNHPEKS